MICALLLALAGTAPATPSLQERTDTSFAVPARGTLILENHAGSVLVRGADARRVHVRATHPAQTRVEIRSDNGTVRVDGTVRSGAPRDVRYEVTVPIGWDVRVTGHRTDIVIEGTRGALNVVTNDGDVRARDVGAANIVTVNGEINLTGASGNVHASAVNDAILISRVTGDVEASSVNGSVQLGDVDGRRVTAATVNGRVQFSGPIHPGGEYAFDTHNGDVTLTLAANTGADVTVATHGGSVEADFPVQVRGDVARTGVLRFTIGAGGARLRAQSFNGAIRIERANARSQTR